MTHVILPRVPLLWNPPPARYVILNRTYSIARVENTKAFLFKEPKLLVQTMDGGGNKISSPLSFGKGVGGWVLAVSGNSSCILINANSTGEILVEI